MGHCCSRATTGNNGGNRKNPMKSPPIERIATTITPAAAQSFDTCRERELAFTMTNIPLSWQVKDTTESSNWHAYYSFELADQDPDDSKNLYAKTNTATLKFSGNLKRQEPQRFNKEEEELSNSTSSPVTSATRPTCNVHTPLPIGCIPTDPPNDAEGLRIWFRGDGKMYTFYLKDRHDNKWQFNFATMHAVDYRKAVTIWFSEFRLAPVDRVAAIPANNSANEVSTTRRRLHVNDIVEMGFEYTFPCLESIWRRHQEQKMTIDDHETNGEVLPEDDESRFELRIIHVEPVSIDGY